MAGFAVRLVRVDLDPGGERVRELEGLLSADERARAATFMRAESRRRFAVARGQLREELAAELDMDPSRVPIKGRRPRLGPARGGPDVRFSVSHSGEECLIAIARGRDVGVDVERHRARRHPRRLSERLLGDPGASEQAIHDEWCRREARFKCTGEAEASAQCEVSDLDLGPGLSGAVAVAPAA